MAAAEAGQLEVLKWLKERGFCLKKRVCLVAAKNGYLEVLKWARENGASCEGEHSGEIVSIASLGHLSILRNAIESGGTFHPNTCKDAAKMGNLEVLKWAREWGSLGSRNLTCRF